MHLVQNVSESLMQPVTHWHVFTHIVASTLQVGCCNVVSLLHHEELCFSNRTGTAITSWHIRIRNAKCKQLSCESAEALEISCLAAYIYI